MEGLIIYAGCGDSVCDASESCSSCIEDCGPCCKLRGVKEEKKREWKQHTLETLSN